MQTGFDTIDIFTGQAHSRADLIQGIESVNTEKGGPRTEEFLKVCMSVRGEFWSPNLLYVFTVWPAKAKRDLQRLARFARF